MKNGVCYFLVLMTSYEGGIFDVSFSFMIFFATMNFNCLSPHSESFVVKSTIGSLANLLFIMVFCVSFSNLLLDLLLIYPSSWYFGLSNELFIICVLMLN